MPPLVPIVQRTETIVVGEYDKIKPHVRGGLDNFLNRTTPIRVI